MNKFGLYDALDDMIVVLDAEGTIVYENQAWIEYGEKRGRPPESTLVGDSYHDHINTISGTEVWEKVECLLTGDKEKFLYEFPCHGPIEKDWYKLRGSTVTVDSEFYVVLQYSNISVERTLKQEVNQLQTFLTSHEGYIDHEMKNKATVILGHADMLESKLGTIEPQYVDDFIRPIKLAVNEILEVVDNNSASAPVFRSTEKKEVDVEDVIERAWAKLIHKNIDLSLDVPHALYADEVQLRHFVENILYTSTELQPTEVVVGLVESGNGFFIETEGTEEIVELELVGEGVVPDELTHVKLINRIAKNHEWDVEYEESDDSVCIYVRNVEWFCNVDVNSSD